MFGERGVGVSNYHVGTPVYDILGEFKYCLNPKCNTDVSVKMGVNAALDIPATCLC